MKDSTYRQAVRDAQAGKRESFDELTRTHRQPIVRLCARLLGDVHEAEDAAQDALAAAYQKLDELRDPSKFAPWLNTIAINECRRRPRRELPIALAVPEMVADRPGSGPGRTDLGAVLAEAARQLLQYPPRQAAAAALFYFHGASYAQIAEHLDTTPAAVQSLLQRARIRLRGQEAGILRKGEAMTEDSQTELEHVVSTPRLLVEDLSLGEHRWGDNRLCAEVSNRTPGPLYLGLDIRACVANSTNWQRGSWHELAGGEKRRFREEYRIHRVFSPWYAVFRGPGVARVRVTFALGSKEQATPAGGRPPMSVISLPEQFVFQKWFDVVVPADEYEAGVPVKPVLPAAGDVTLEELDPGALHPGQHRMALTLRNHTQQARALGFHIDTPGWGGQIEQRAVRAGEGASVCLPYTIYEDYRRHVGQGERAELLLKAFQYPLNLDELDLEGENFPFTWRYIRSVPEAMIAERRMPIP